MTLGLFTLSACASASPAQEIRFDAAKEGAASISDIAQKVEGVEDVFFAANCKDVLTEAVEATANVNHGFYFNESSYVRTQMGKDFTVGWRVWESYYDMKASPEQKAEWVKKKRIEKAKGLLLGGLSDLRPMSAKGEAFSSDIDACYKPVAKARAAVSEQEELING
jgi:hypothetical protein